MKLTEIYRSFETDKGTAHSYIPYYESLFNKIRLDKLNVLEIGVLFGGSLKMWSTYFANSKIFGVDNFAQKTGEEYYNHKPVDVNMVKESLTNYKNVTLFDFNCESKNCIASNFTNLKFDIIIDDASHTSYQQFTNLTNLSKFLNVNGIYICEDIQSYKTGDILLNHAKTLFQNKKCEIVEFNCDKRQDDRLLVIT